MGDQSARADSHSTPTAKVSTSLSVPDTADGDTKTLGAAAALRRQIFDLHTVFDIARRFHSVTDVDTLMEGILLTTIGQLEVGAAAVAVPDSPDCGQLSRSKWKGWSNARETDWTLPLDSPLALHLIACRGPVTIKDAEETLPPESIEQLRVQDCQLIAPLISRNKLRGVLYTSGKLDSRPFGEADTQFLGLLLEQLSVTIDNALLHESERTTAAQLLSAREDLARAEKLSALGHLVATVAHEVNNPLGIIKNYIQLLRPALGNSQESAGKLEMISREVERMVRFVRGLFAAFHTGSRETRAVEVEPILREVTRFASPELAARRIRIVSALPNVVPAVWGDAEALRHVFLNLTLNARDAMPEGGVLTVTVSVDDGWLTIRFADEGSGIDSSVAEELFEPFVTTKPQTDGTGLGLSVCQSIVEGFGGSITGTNLSPPGRGAVFSVRLPCVSDSPAHIPSRHTTQEEP
jgi:signal transduction histidine kinase